MLNLRSNTAPDKQCSGSASAFCEAVPYLDWREIASGSTLSQIRSSLFFIHIINPFGQVINLTGR
jgi:hypothetical protein